MSLIRLQLVHYLVPYFIFEERYEIEIKRSDYTFSIRMFT